MNLYDSLWIFKTSSVLFILSPVWLPHSMFLLRLALSPRLSSSTCINLKLINVTSIKTKVSTKAR